MKFSCNTRIRFFERMFESPRFRGCLINVSCSQFLLSTVTDDYWVSEAVSLSVAQKWKWGNRITKNSISCFKNLVEHLFHQLSNKNDQNRALRLVVIKKRDNKLYTSCFCGL